MDKSLLFDVFLMKRACSSVFWCYGFCMWLQNMIKF